MVAQKGKDLLLKIDKAGLGTFVTVAGMRSRRVAFNAETVDVTDFQSTGRWRELLAGSGVQSVSVSGSGIFKDAASDEDIRQVFFAGDIVPWEITIPDFGALSGLFQVTALEYSAQHNAEVGYDMALESAGQITFVAAT